MDPNTALAGIRGLIKQYNELGVWGDRDLWDVVCLLLELIDHVVGLDKWLSRGGHLPKEWEWAHSAGRA
ncbi:hypothetical protein ACFYUD_31770 [Nocardia tengchongensis]|uniref:hypothetical protein n=1 Tax=Nocardia tengchongensis TaxID=2055889 RepID=UPI003691C322